jgi:shikimate kinase
LIRKDHSLNSLNEHSNNNVVLIGFMGSGKSSVGECLAKVTKRKFVDSDTVIETFEGKSIRDIFAQNGEPYFRAQEQACIHWMKSNLKNCVIATGGGMPIYSEGLDEVGKVIYLEASFESIKERLQGKEQGKRPLASEIASLEKLYNSRLDKYVKSASLCINVDRDIDTIVNQILKEENE